MRRKLSRPVRRGADGKGSDNRDLAGGLPNPFIAAQADRGGLWTGSGNQRVIELAETRRRGGLVLDPGSTPDD
jgi:hypothetical protein